MTPTPVLGTAMVPTPGAALEYCCVAWPVLTEPVVVDEGTSWGLVGSVVVMVVVVVALDGPRRACGGSGVGSLCLAPSSYSPARRATATKLPAMIFPL